LGFRVYWEKMKHKLLQGGFTVVEALIGLATASVLILLSFSLTQLTSNIVNNTKRYLAVNEAAFAKMQEYENKSFNNIVAGTAPSFEVEDFSAVLAAETDPLIKNPSAKVFVEPLSGSLRKVRIYISYESSGTTRFIEYATYVQMGGVGR
jgi:competence protein ComGC